MGRCILKDVSRSKKITVEEDSQGDSVKWHTKWYIIACAPYYAAQGSTVLSFDIKRFNLAVSTW